MRDVAREVKLPGCDVYKQHCFAPLFVCIGREVRCFWYLRHICSKNSDWQSPVAHNIERLLLDSSLPPQQIAWYVKSLTSEEEQVGDTRAAIMLASSTQITNVHVDMHGWHSCLSNSFLSRGMANYDWRWFMW
jgi:hypothetical protein